MISAVCQGLLSCRRHIGKREDPGDEVDIDLKNSGLTWNRTLTFAMTGRNAIALLSHYSGLGRTKLSFSERECNYLAEKYSNADDV